MCCVCRRRRQLDLILGGCGSLVIKSALFFALPSSNVLVFFPICAVLYVPSACDDAACYDVYYPV